MIKLKSAPERQPRRHRRRWLRLLLLLVPVVVLVTERWRGQWALKRWTTEMVAKGEVFEASKLWPPVSARSVEFSNQLAAATAQLSLQMRSYAGQVSGMVVAESGVCRRGSQEARPPLFGKPDATNTWQDLAESVQQSEPILKSLRELMKDPPVTPAYDAQRILEHDSLPNYVAVRIGAQALQTATMDALHRSDLTRAAQDVGTLLSFARLYEDDPTLVNYMIRIAILGLSVDVCWDALQAGGWTEPQLATLQRSCLDTRRVLSQLPRTLEAERVSRVYRLNWLSSHDYQGWIGRYQQTFESIGWKLPATDTSGPAMLWRQWVFHPLWRFAWADQEELAYLRQSQLELTLVRDAVQHRSLLRLKEQSAVNRENYRAPAAAWRFYMKLPLVEYMYDSSGSHPRSGSYSRYPYADFTRSWSITMKNLTLHEMVITAIAIKRFETKHGKPPASLAALVPDFLAALPYDFMDGQPLRYRLNADGSFTLYSVGENMRDDGGNLLPGETNQAQDASPWAGRDWVWPQVVGVKPEQRR